MKDEIEDIDKEERNFAEQDVRKAAGGDAERDLSSGASSFDSEASRYNFWRDINETQEIKGAIVLSSQQPGESRNIPSGTRGGSTQASDGKRTRRQSRTGRHQMASNRAR